MNPNKAAWGDCYKLYVAALEEAQHVEPPALWVWFWSQAAKIMDKWPGDKLAQGLLLATFEQVEVITADIAAGTTTTNELRKE